MFDEYVNVNCVDTLRPSAPLSVWIWTKYENYLTEAASMYNIYFGASWCRLSSNNEYYSKQITKLIEIFIVQFIIINLSIFCCATAHIRVTSMFVSSSSLKQKTATDFSENRIIYWIKFHARIFSRKKIIDIQK